MGDSPPLGAVLSLAPASPGDPTFRGPTPPLCKRTPTDNSVKLMEVYPYRFVKRKISLVLIMLCGFVLFFFYALTLTCCQVGVNSELDQALKDSKIVLLDTDEERYQRDIDRLGNVQNYNHLMRKTLVQNHRDSNGNTDKAVKFVGYYPVKTSSSEDETGYPYEDGEGEDSSINSNYPQDYYDNDIENKRTRSHGSKSRHAGIQKIQKGATKKLPTALIIGVKKGGTRALLEFLRMHPDVRAPGPEPHFFDRKYHKGLEWYRQQMPPTIEGQLTIEKTPSYFVTKEVPGRIYNMSKSVKLIVVVRNPVTRAISDYTQTFSKRPDLKSFEQMAFLNNSTGLVDTSWGAIRIGVYARHLERWLKYFPTEQIHFVSGEKLISEPAREMAKVQDFLGLNHVITDKHFFFNTTKGFPCLKKPEGSGNPHCLGKTKGRTHPQVDEKVIKRLNDFFRPFNAKFYQMVGVDFGWS